MENTKQAPITIGAEEGQSLSIAGNSYRILVSGSETGGDFATIDMLVPPGGGPGPHSHAHFHETFYVMEGEVEIHSEVSVYTAKMGDYVVIPKGGIIHYFKNKTDKNVRLLCTVIPSGLEEMFIAISKEISNGQLSPSPDSQGLKQMQQIAEKYGQQFYPPDYLGSNS